MNIQHKKKTILISILIIFALFFVLFNNSKNSNDQEENNYSNNHNSVSAIISGNLDLSEKTILQKFEMFEFSEMVNTKENINSLDFVLPSPTWNITNLELNFTDITLSERELKTIEDQGVDDSDFEIYVQNVNWYCKKLGVQLKITEPTTIYGVYIFGYASALSETLKFEINGYDEALNIPNDTVYTSIDLNISNSVGWYYQNFSSYDPITLPVGNYSLVINGMILDNDSPTEIHWYKNNINPLNPDLFSSKYEKFSATSPEWENEIGSTFLHKLVYKSNVLYNPEDINMTAVIGDNSYPISDGVDPGTGDLVLSNINLAPNSEILHVPISINRSGPLVFNLSSKIKMKNTFFSDGSVLIKENSNNLWTIKPTLTRQYNNYSIKFDYPISWKNVSVFRKTDGDFVNITSSPDVIKNGNTLLILNDTIIPLAEWKITAQSVKINFTLDVLKTEYGAGENLGFYVDTPILLGNYTFALYDAIGLPVVVLYKEVKINELSTFSFNFTIPTPPSNSGDWIGYVYWNNFTDAGVKNQNFQISGDGGGGDNTLPPSNGGGDDNGGDKEDSDSIDPVFVITTIIVVGIVSTVGFSSYVLHKKITIKQEMVDQKLYNRFMDVLNLNHIMVIHKKSGLNLYDQSFSGQKLNPTLISGFISAFKMFGEELTNGYKKSQISKMEYENLQILISDFKNLRVAFILKENPSKNLLKTIPLLSNDIKYRYNDKIDNFNGDTSQFEGIYEIIEKYLHVSFISPLKIVMTEKTKLSRSERLLFFKAKHFMKMNQINYFFAIFLMPNQMYDSKNAEIISKLIERKIFKPVYIR